MAKTQRRASYPFNGLYLLFRQAIRFGKVKFFFDDDGEIIGCVVWATLAADVETRFIRDLNFTLHPSEWDEGDSLWIIDLIVINDGLKYVLEHIRDVLFKEYDRVRYGRLKRDKVYFKEISRNAKLSFFANAE
jgi:cytolysin-activating lysine-acyltransferase